MKRMSNAVVEYAWGSHSVLAEMLGEPSPSPRPQAELWMGAHPAAPSRVETEAGVATGLDAVIAAAPVETLGVETHRRFGGQLPFLLKVLAIDQPLSMQAHPNLEQARAGFEREEALGLARDSPRRRYRDANHKPEILCALSPFEALVGFRPVAETIGLLERLQCEALAPVTAALAKSPPDGLRAAFELLMTMDADRQRDAVEQVAAACRRTRDVPDRHRASLRWAGVLAERYPGDIGVASSLLMNHVRLEPGEAIHLPAGRLHCYLRGVGIELMANSDNVLRGGLTPKHVDVPELISVLEFRDEAVSVVPSRPDATWERRFLTPAPDFCLSVIELDGAQDCRPERRGPEILLCVEGSADVTPAGGEKPLSVSRGQSVFVPAADPPYRLTGRARLFRATVGDVDAGRAA